MTDLDANRSASYLTATAENAPQLGDPDPAALVAHDGETDSSHKSAWQRLKDAASNTATPNTPGDERGGHLELGGAHGGESTTDGDALDDLSTPPSLRLPAAITQNNDQGGHPE